MLNAASVLAGLLALEFGVAVAAGLLSGVAKLAFWVPAGAFVILLLVGFVIDRARR